MELYMRRRGILKPPPRSAFHLQFFIDPLQEPASWCDCPRSAHKQETCALVLNFGEGFFSHAERGPRTSSAALHSAAGLVAYSNSRWLPDLVLQLMLLMSA